MTGKSRKIRNLAFCLLVAALLAPTPAGAIRVKKSLYSGRGARSGASGPRRKNPLTKAVRQRLAEIVAGESEVYLSEESEKKADGQRYIDLEHAKFKYFPKRKKGKISVKAKLEAAEYKPRKKNSRNRGRPTGKRKVLIFNYRLDGKKWVEIEPPKWEDVKKVSASAKK